MLKIRLTRMGAKKNPFYRIVVIDAKLVMVFRPKLWVGMIQLSWTHRYRLMEKRLFIG